MKHAEGVLCLPQEFVPKLGRKMTIGDAQSRDEMVFEGLNCTLGSVHMVLVRWNELPLYIVIAEVFSDGSGGFIIENIEFWLEPFSLQL